MKLGSLFIDIVARGDVKKLDKSINKLEKAKKHQKDLLQYRKDLAKATSKEEKELVKKNFADKVRLDNLKKQRDALKEQKAQWLGLVKGVGAFITGATIAYKVIDRMVSSLAQANQQMISFQRQTGISFASLNKYASANAAVNFNSSIEGTAQSMQRLAQNLWDIQMGRGDVSPYQELAFVGGKAFNPYGMSVEQVIENVREAIKGVDDIQATNIISRMGFAPDDILMLRMSREEFEKINSLFLDSKSREALNQYSLQLKKINLQFNLLKEKTLLKIMPYFVKLTKHLVGIADALSSIANQVFKNEGVLDAFKAIGLALTGALLILNPLLAKFSLLYIILEDIVYFMAGKKSLLGDLIEGTKGFDKKLTSEEYKSEHPVKSLLYQNLKDTADLFPLIHLFNEWNRNKTLDPVNSNNLSYGGNNISTNNSFSITTQQPMDVVANNLINTFTPIQAQFNTGIA